MSQKTPQSGLRTFKRSFSETESASQPTSFQKIPRLGGVKPESAAAKLRLEKIQEALNKKHAQSMQSSEPNAQGPSQPSRVQPLAKKPRLSRDNDPLMVSSMSKSSSSSRPPGPVKLSEEQTKILELAKAGENVFYTGSAGTGKSVLLREIIKSLRKKYVKAPDAVAVTASTGIAACNIGGTTIHSFAGIGLGIESAEDLAKRVQKNRKAASRWMRTKALIIDEVSMVDGELFDKLSGIGRIIRKNSKAFGGIQIIVTGDFFQLPPVTKNGTVKFAFEADIWREAMQNSFNLSVVFRQRDQEFIDMLNEMRFGRLSSGSIVKFKSLSRPIEYEDGIQPTELFPRREDVERSNNNRMQVLDSEAVTYDAIDGGMLAEPNQREKILSNFMAPKKLVLRVNAQVMLIKNMEDGFLANGSMGKVVGFDDMLPEDMKPPKRTSEKYPVVQFVLSDGTTRTMLMTRETWKVELPNGEVQVSRSQFPLILSWAMSIHKSQGQTLDRVKVDLGRIFEKGQAYVALSRATSLQGLQVLNFDPAKVNAHPRVMEWSRTLLSA